MWLFVPSSYQEGQKEKHYSSEHVQSAFIVFVEDAVCLSEG